MKKLNGFLLSSLLLVSCAKERPFEEVYKDPLIASKATIDTDSEFLYVPNSQGVPRFTSSMAPFVQGNERIVKFRFKESGLVAYQMDQSAEFSDNPLNNKPVLTIPVDYKSYRCRENGNKECTNAEEENSELQWFEKDRFIPKFESVIVHEADSIGLPDSSDSCFFERDTKLVHREVTRDVVNFELEKTYEFSKSPGCVEQLWYDSDSYEEFLNRLDDNGAFHVRVFFSFVKLEKIADKQYEKIEYPTADQGIFGFFKTSIREKNVNREEETKFLMNRWSPNKDVVEYYLSDEFAKPQNEYLKRATHLAFDRMNKTLERGGVKLRLHLNDPSNKKPGDLRNSMIILIEDLASPLLGYGPTVANPRTGEIIKGHVNMYKGSLESYAPYTYDSLRFFEEQERRRNSNIPEEVKSLAEGSVSSELISSVRSHHEKKNEKTRGDLLGSRNFNVEKALNFYNQPKPKNFTERLANKIKTAQTNGQFLSNEEKAIRHTLNEVVEKAKIFEILRRNSVYTVDMFNFDNLGKEALPEVNQIKGVRDENGILLPWERLDLEQQKKLTEVLVVHAYVPTLVHEVGHNLGLRHNFEGSVDKENFYAHDDHNDLGIRNSRYSSIMDYAYSSLNELSTFGKYDLAALKFAYNREVELVDGSTQKVDGPLFTKRGQIKEFKFCTDENAGASLTCNRFDEGSNESEIARHMVESYESAYQYRNLKGRRKNFNDIGVWRYLISTYNRMMDFRSIHESWQGLYVFLKQYNLESVMNGCTDGQRAQFPDLCELSDKVNDANKVVGRYMLDLVKSPDLTCHVLLSAKDGDRQILKNRSLFLKLSEDIEDIRLPLPDNKGFYRPTDCFNEGVKKNYADNFKSILVRQCAQTGVPTGVCQQNISVDVVMAGQAGQFHNDVSKASRTDETSLVGDLEIRGNWVDKLLAIDVLTNRDLMTTAGASNHLSFADMPMFKGEIENLIRHLALGEPLIGQVPFRAVDGTEYHSTEMFDVNIKTKVHRLKNFLQIFFKFPDFDNYDFAPVLLEQAASASYESLNNLPRDLEIIKDRTAFRDSFTAVYLDRVRDNRDFGSAIVSSIDIPGLGKSLGATESNTIALELIKRVKGEDADKIKELREKIAAADGEGEAREEGRGLKIANKVIGIQEVAGRISRDLLELDQVVSEGHGPAEIGQILEKRIGKRRASTAFGIMLEIGKAPETELEAELREVDLTDLKLAVASEEEEKEMREKFQKSLISLPAR